MKRSIFPVIAAALLFLSTQPVQAGSPFKKFSPTTSGNVYGVKIESRKAFRPSGGYNDTWRSEEQAQRDIDARRQREAEQAQARRRAIEEQQRAEAQRRAWEAQQQQLAYQNWLKQQQMQAIKPPYGGYQPQPMNGYRPTREEAVAIGILQIIDAAMRQ